jgi:phage gpG-like protein
MMADSMHITITDNTEKTLEELQAVCLKALETCGLAAEKYAKNLVNSPGKTGTGNLRNSISHTVDPANNTAYVYTNVEYAPYQELGTGIYYEGGRQDPWVYQDAKGNWHWTHGNPAKPFIKPAVADHAADYRAIIERTLKNG